MSSGRECYQMWVLRPIGQYIFELQQLDVSWRNKENGRDATATLFYDMSRLAQPSLWMSLHSTAQIWSWSDEFSRRSLLKYDPCKWQKKIWTSKNGRLPVVLRVCSLVYQWSVTALQTGFSTNSDKQSVGGLIWTGPIRVECASADV